ncbi:hypothetical protein C815_01958 [Firmicutes bacterium M10-2]|nr:hypothetical protein C815_01958 [Firmicutes bacterium M10-2]
MIMKNKYKTALLSFLFRTAPTNWIVDRFMDLKREQWKSKKAQIQEIL